MASLIEFIGTFGKKTSCLTDSPQNPMSMILMSMMKILIFIMIIITSTMTIVDIITVKKRKLYNVISVIRN